MKTDLLKILLTKKVLNKGMVVTANYVAVGLSGDPNVRASGDFTIEGVGNACDKIMGTNTRDHTSRIIPVNDITIIEGMDINRFARSYGIMPTGLNETIGRKRGRKSAEDLKQQALLDADDDIDDLDEDEDDDISDVG